jgi:hypothetical protein|tara:strand:- start:21 stop:281 length:261 start_codon:yes stop_codon:yes gene_type:complete
MNLRKINADGVVTYAELEWPDVLSVREDLFPFSDLWMLADRYSQLTSAQQTELTSFRQELRDITDYATANEAGENFPDMPVWMITT